MPLTAAEEREVVESYRAGIGSRTLARRYRVAPATVLDAVRRAGTAVRPALTPRHTLLRQACDLRELCQNPPPWPKGARFVDADAKDRARWRGRVRPSAPFGAVAFRSPVGCAAAACVDAA
ncbi:MAG: hypothetical protein SFV21_12600 [Rhodospirillaceae bacterium]|nr:hypothetical protein [Rhodospirillaceae bacterium]